MIGWFISLVFMIGWFISRNDFYLSIAVIFALSGSIANSGIHISEAIKKLHKDE